MRVLQYAILFGVPFLILAACIPFAHAAANASLPIYFFVRAPYAEPDMKGVVRGLTADPVRRAAQLTRVSVYWTPMPAAAQLEAMRTDAIPACALGWFRTTEREQFARFSSVIYQDSPSVGLARGDHPTLGAPMTVQDALANPSLLLLMKRGFSYGSYVDGLIESLKPHRHQTVHDNKGMLQMISGKRADYMFIAPEEAEHLFATTSFKKEDFRIIHFTDMPQGNARHLMCTKSTPDSVLQRLNLGLQGMPWLPTVPQGSHTQ